MKKKHLVIVGVIILSAIVILGLYQTFALSGDITKDTNGYYNVTVTDGTTVTVPAGSSKTVYYKLTNTNKGTVKYGVGYSGANITVKYYTDTQDPVTGTVDYGKSKYIKLFVQNSGTTSSTATLSTILGYENGGDLIVPSGVTLVTESYMKPVNAATYITNLYTEASKTTVTNNSIIYRYDTTHSLMEDVYGNIRYYGKSKVVGTIPAWQSDDTERTIGYFDSEESCLAEMETNYNICSPDLDGYENYGYSDQATCEAEYDWGNAMFGESMTYNEGKEKYCTGTANKYELVEPNNYIYFNCSDYSNQTSSTCEKWRIIGVFEGKVKIMRGSTIGKLAWDQDKNINSSLKTYDNDWTTASLQVLLNQKYYNGDTAGTITYYSGSSGSTSTNLNMSSIGIKNDTTRNLISDTLYYLGGWNDFEIFSNQIYGYERGTTVYSGRPTTWTGKIALPYPSDYGYAADLGSCTVQLGNYNYSTCTSTNWMKNIITNNGNEFGWLLTPSSSSSAAWNVDSYGGVYSLYTSYASGVVPVLYLNSELAVKAGTGSSSEPYQLSA